MRVLPPTQKKKSARINVMCFKACLELCEVFRNASSHKTRPHCIPGMPKDEGGLGPSYKTIYDMIIVNNILGAAYTNFDHPP
jgi:hypothetical protein